MAAGLGIAVGTANSDIAIAPGHGAATDDTTFDLISRATVLHVSTDGTPFLPGSSADDTGLPVSGYVERVGDPVGLLDDGGRVHLGEDLFAATVAGLIDAADAPDPADVVVTYPTTWNGYTVAALESALDRSGVATARLVPEALACVRWLESARGPLDDGVVVVYDLGASALDVAVVRTGTQPAVIGRPLRSEEFAGDSIDHAVTRHFLDGLAGRTEGLDPFDAGTTAALGELRRRCTRAKEALSADTETTLSVALPGTETDVRLVRSELEDLLREPLSRSLELVRDALRAAEVEGSDVTAVLLAGGGGSIPLVAELVSSELGLTVVAAPDPARTAAYGAALLASDTPVEAVPPAAGPDDDRDLRTAPVPIVPSFPTRIHSTRSGSSMRRRIAVVASAAAAIAVLTAGGLAIGTASSPAPAQSNSSATGGSTSPGAATTTAGGGTSVPGQGTAETVTVGHTGTGAPVPALAGTNGVISGAVARTAGAPGTPGAPTSDGTPGAPVIAQDAPPQPTPGGTEPGGGTPPPVYTPPAPGGGATGPVVTGPVVTGPSPSEVGDGIGKAATGVGKGLGAVVTGIGTGVGNIVGAVVDPVTGLLIGN